MNVGSIERWFDGGSMYVYAGGRKGKHGKDI